MGSGNPRHAYVEEETDDNRSVRTSHSTASSSKGKKSSRDSQSSKEKKANSDAAHASGALPVPADVPPRKAESVKSSSKERRKSSSATSSKISSKISSKSSSKSPQKPSQPQPTSRSSIPPLDTNVSTKDKSTDASFFGVSPDGRPAVVAQSSQRSTSRPPLTSLPQAGRSSRPQSLYGVMPTSSHKTYPPIAPSAFYPSSTIGTSYPPQSPPVSPNSYFPPQSIPSERDRLASRFGSGSSVIRTASASGVRPRTRDYKEYYGYDSAGDRNYQDSRQNSIRRPSELEDRARVPQQSAYRRPTAETRIIPDAYPSGVYEDMYDSRVPRSQYREEVSAPRRPSLPRGPVTFHSARDSDKIREEILNGRRASYHESRARPGDYDDKIQADMLLDQKMRANMNLATGYQDDIAGGPPINLTAEALRRQQQQRRTATSSRSTRSSGSRDESDFNKRSATTRTTRSGSGPEGEDFTIKFKGAATVNIGGAEIKCEDGAEVNIIQRSKSIRNGSEMSSSDYGRSSAGDRRSRDGWPKNVTRSSSKSVRPSATQYGYI